MDSRFQHQSYERKESNDTRNMKNINFVPKDVQRILSSPKILEKYNEQKVFYKKLFSIISQYLQKITYVSVSFSIKMQACNFIKKRLQHRCFLVKFAKILRTLIFTEHLRWPLCCNKFPKLIAFQNSKLKQRN